MLCRLTKLLVICLVTVWSTAGYAGLWDAPPLPNGDFVGASDEIPAPFKRVPPTTNLAAPTVVATPITAPVARVANRAMIASTPLPGQSTASVFTEAPVYTSVPQQELPVPQYVVPQVPTPVAVPPSPQPMTYQASAMTAPCATGCSGNLDAMSMAQTTYSHGSAGSDWGLFRPFVSSSGAWGRRGARPRFYGGSEYLFWVTRGQRFPALVTTSPDGTPITEAGRLDFPGTTTVVFGDRRLASNEHSGYRSYIGMNLDCAGCNRIEADYFDLDQEDFYWDRSAPGDYTILARPFYNTFLGTEDAELIGYPGEVDGQITVAGSTNFEGLGVWLRHSLLRCCPTPQCDPCGAGACGGGVSPYYATGAGINRKRWRLNRLDLLAGYRRYELEDDTVIREFLRITNPAGPVPVDTEFDIFDNFRTENRFDGADLGIDWEWTRGRLGLSVMGKAAIGNLRQRACVDGFTSVLTPGQAPVNYDYGLMTLSSNSGSVERNRFTVIPEIGLDVYYQLNCNTRFRVGYSMIYFPTVIRPGGLMDTNLDPQLFPPPTITAGRFPQARFQEEDFWVQGLRLGAEFCF